jgi:Butyrate kinase
LNNTKNKIILVKELSGEFEQEAMAEGALRVLRKEEFEKRRTQ